MSEWITYDGGDCPVDPSVLVMVRSDSGNESGYPTRADSWAWGKDCGIKAYKVVEHLTESVDSVKCSDDEPAFPFEIRNTSGSDIEGFCGGVIKNGGSRHFAGLSQRQYAAIELKVPNSGIDWLDEMIKESRRLNAAEKVMQAIMSNPDFPETMDLAKHSVEVAEAFIGAIK